MRISRITASEDGKSKNQLIVDLLNSHRLDTKICRYELAAERYERYEAGARYRKTFACPGDWLAYFSMCFHGAPNYDRLEDWYGQDVIEELEYMISKYPTIDDMAEHAAEYWWGDGDDHIFSLKNLTTGKILYSDGEEYEEYEEEEDW